MRAEQLSGPEISFNNVLDGEAAWRVVSDFAEPAAAVVKHNNPCGLSVDEDQTAAYRKAYEGDSMSAYGGIVAFNRTLAAATARAMRGVFYNVVIAPDFEPEALEVLKRRRQARVLRVAPACGPTEGFDVRKVSGGAMLQAVDDIPVDTSSWETRSRREPTESELRDLAFAWKAAKHVRSNSIVLARDLALVGMGAGQPNRVTSVHLALRVAGERSRGTVLASDAFFPFADGVELAAEGGVTAVAEPGGSLRVRRGDRSCRPARPGPGLHRRTPLQALERPVSSSVSLVLPVLNEERGLASSTLRLHEYLTANLAGYDWRIVIADNGSTDSTPDLAMQLAREHDRVGYLRIEQRGRGRALKKAWLESDADIRGYMDIDLSTELEAIPRLIQSIESGGYDLAIGSRLKKGAVVSGRTLLREVISRGYSLLFRTMFLTGFSDAQCGFKAVSRRAARDLLPLVQDNGWFFDTELLLLAEKNGYRIDEIPVRWTDDPDSRVRIVRTAWDDFRGLLRLRFGGLRRASRTLSERSR